MIQRNVLTAAGILAASSVGSFFAAQQILWGTVFLMEHFAPVLYIGVGAAATAFILGNNYTNRERAYRALLNDFVGSDPNMASFMSQRLLGVGVKVPPPPPTATPPTAETGTAFDAEVQIPPQPKTPPDDPVAKLLNKRGIHDQPPPTTHKNKRSLRHPVVKQQQ